MSIPAPNRMTPIAGGVEAGIRWVICRAPLYGAVNGYARMPEGHQWRTKNLQDEDYGLLDAPGGITYGPTEDGWVGFDTLHAGDLWPEGDGPHFCRSGQCDCTLWTEDMVAEEAKSLARQIAAADPTLATEVDQ